jgi:DNA polymerase III subunit gamma/tau
MDNFIVSARKYRPDTFDAVVGQGAITQTLKNAIRNNHLAQAYLFCGPRGVGKTTCARILAKVINCFDITDNIEACNVCESCTAFNTGRSYNIHELDAASNNSVEDIRNLIEQVRIPPQMGKYNIYIIDEVHMLSASAFNAFLKTLEEPPAHAIFILATTEKHKIIPTILSRCQIFDFSRIQIKDAVQYLSDIATKEGIDFEEDAFNIIAQKADGGMRDALSIFDQIVAFCGKKIEYKDVIENLNILDYEHYFNLTEIFMENNYPEALSVYDQIVNQGFDPRNFINGLSSHFRDLLVCKEKAILQLLEVGDSIKDRYLLQTTNCDAAFLLDGLNLISKADTEYNQSRNKRLHVELLLMNLCQLANKKKNRTDTDVKEDKRENRRSGGSDNSDSQKQESSKSLQENKTEQNGRRNGPLRPAPSAPKTTISIKNALQGEEGKSSNNKKAEDDDTDSAEEPDDVQQNENSVEEDLSKEKIHEGWQTFLDQIKQGKPRLHSVLSMSDPLLKDRHILLCKVANQMQKDHLGRTKQDLVAKLREIFQHQHIEIDFVVDDTLQTASQGAVLTNEDKFNQLAAKNPSLVKLRKDFSLDFE